MKRVLFLLKYVYLSDKKQSSSFFSTLITEQRGYPQSLKHTVQGRLL